MCTTLTKSVTVCGSQSKLFADSVQQPEAVGNNMQYLMLMSLFHSVPAFEIPQVSA